MITIVLAIVVLLVLVIVTRRMTIKKGLNKADYTDDNGSLIHSEFFKDHKQGDIWFK